MDADLVIELRDLNKSYSLETRPWHRLWHQLRGRTEHGPQHHALRRIDLQVRRGEVVGIIGRNGAGKSTLLQIVCGVLAPTRGRRVVQGRIAALLELGAGFNPELTGRENVRLNGPLLGLTSAQVERLLPDIVEFAGIGDFIDQPVRSYSSGMFVRLAFSMATSVEPDILVIDEALSVGDGAFAHKSFERIMALRARGATILFCSHSMFQIEQLCSRALWIHAGELRFDGPAHLAVLEYDAWQAQQDGEAGSVSQSTMHTEAAQIESFERLGGGDDAPLRSGTNTLCFACRLRSDARLPVPTMGIVVHGSDGRAITSAGSWLDGVDLQRDAQGRIEVSLTFPRLPLLRGRYTASLYVLCDRAVNLWAAAEHALSFEVAHEGPQQGVVDLAHTWQHPLATPGDDARSDGSMP